MTSASAPPAHAAHPLQPGRGRLRGDIEGLRAIAVLMVLAYHVGLPGSGGGFAGVDVFFVISGYLITSQLVREAQREGRISLPRFYARRARRLLPAATVVLVVTTVSGWLLLPRGRHADLGAEVLAATGYVVNWLFAAREVDYLAEDQAPSLVQHYWSLSVEEQFYVVWPLLIIAVLWLARRWRLRLIPVLTLVLGVLIVASATWSVVHTADSPGTAYFVTTTRAWQLGVGAMLVLLTPLLERLPRYAATLAAVVGLTGIGATVLTISTNTPWPGSAAALPTLATALVIAAGITWPANPVAKLLGVPPMMFLGGLSYGLYLWHWPALQFLVELYPTASLSLRALVGAGSVLLAWATLRLVEDPVRYSSRLSVRPAPALLLAGVAMLVSAVASGALWASAPVLQVQTPIAGQGGMALIDTASRDAQQLRAVADPGPATRHTDRLLPDPAVVDEDISLAYRDGCQVTTEGTEIKPESTCWFGDPDGKVRVALVGDSKMEHWSSALHAIGLAEGWRVKIYTKSGCGFVDEGRTEGCHDYNRRLSELLGEAEHAPDLIFTSLGHGYAPELEDSLVRMLQPALDAGAEVVLIGDTPYPRPSGLPDSTVYDCLDRHRENFDPCWSEVLPAPGTPLLRATAQRVGAPLIDLLPWICPEPELLGGCAPVIGGVVVNRQGSHLSATYVRTLTPVLHHELVRAGVARTPLTQIAWEVPVDPPRET